MGEYVSKTGRNGGGRRVGYVGALLALGLTGSWAFGEAVDNGQAVTPIKISAAEQGAATKPAAKVAGVAERQLADNATISPSNAKAPEPAPAKTPPVILVPPSPSAVATTAPAAADDKAYAITDLKINYYKPDYDQPPTWMLMHSEVTLGVTSDGYTAPKAGVKTVTLSLDDIGHQGIRKIYRSGIEAIYNHVVHFYNDKGIIGVFVVVDSKDIDANDKDIRPATRTGLQLIVVTSHIKQIRTVTSGPGIKEEDRINNPQFAEIRARSPLQAEDSAGDRTDLLNRDLLDDYVLRLNRQPGRRVDAAISGTDQPGEVDLDYLVSQNRPWYVYFQLSNTGTAQTSPWRERLGIVDNQLTGHDDNLTVDYVTSSFDKFNALLASYDRPFFSSDRLRYKVYTTYNQFTASDVGQNKENFTGEEWAMGGELALNIYQHRELFVDLVGGARYQSVRNNDQTAGVSGQVDYVVPYAELRMERNTAIAATAGALTLLYYNTSSSPNEIQALGRADPAKNPTVLQYSFSQSAFLEPLLFPQSFARGRSTLAHEIYISVHGQYAFDQRLFPQAEDVAGGFYSVRGYPESIVAGDSLVVATAEYRFHLPRILPIVSDPSKTPFLWNKSFRYSPSQPYGRPDWDLITRAFVDVGEVMNSQPLPFETNSTLVGTGVGVELQYKQHLNIRVDWGVALTGIPTLVEAGSSRFHISATLLY